MEAIIAADGGHTTYMSSGSEKKRRLIFMSFSIKQKWYEKFLYYGEIDDKFWIDIHLYLTSKIIQKFLLI